MWLDALLGQAGPGADDPFRRPEVIWATAALAGVFLAGAAVIYCVDRWRKKLAERGTAAGELTDFRGMYERGEITEEEYAKLRTRVAQRVKKEVAPPDTSPPKPPNGPANPPPAE